MTRISTSKIYQGFLWTTASYLNNRVFKLIAQVVLARLLTPEEFGLWAMVQIQLSLSERFSESSIAQVLVQRGLNNQKLLNTVYSLGIDVSALLFTVQAAAGFFLARFFAAPILWPLTACAGLTYLVQAGASSHRAVMVRQLKFRELTICDSISAVVGLCGTLSCAAFGGGVWSFVAGNLLSAASSSLFLRSWSNARFKYSFKLERTVVAEIKSFVSGIIGTYLAGYINTNTDSLLVGKLVGKGALGQYNLAYQLALLPQFVLTHSHTVNFSVLSQKNQDQKSRYISKVLELNALLAALLYGVGFLAAPWLIPLVYGSQWVEAVRYFQILLVYAYSRLFMNILGTFLNASNKPSVNAAISWSLVPLSLPAYLVGARLGGPMGVAIAVSVVMGLGGAAWFWLVTSRTSGWQLSSMVKPVLLPTFAACTTIILLQSVPFSGSWQYVQPFSFIIGYSAILCIVSQGRVPKMIVDVIRRSIK